MISTPKSKDHQSGGGAVATTLEPAVLWTEDCRSHARPGAVITDDFRVLGGGFPCAGGLACRSRRAAVGAAEIFRVTETIRRYRTETIREATTLRRAHIKPP